MGLHDVRLSKPGSLKNLDETLPPLGVAVQKDTLKEDPLPAGAMAEEIIKQLSAQTTKVESLVQTVSPVQAKAKPGPKPKKPIVSHAIDVRPDADGHNGPNPYHTESPDPDYLVEYKKRKTRVSFVMDSGTFSMSVMDVKLSTYSIAIITNSDSDASGFIPSLGSSFKLEGPGFSCDCFYPGSCVSIPELSLDIMFLGRQNT